MFVKLIHQQKKHIKAFLVCFLLTLSFGYFSGFDLLNHTTQFNVNGLEKNFLGNELEESPIELKFKMSEKQILNIIHTHVLSLALLFFIVSFLLFFTPIKTSWLCFLSIEPLVSLITTFLGIWLMWKGLAFMKYIVMISGILMHLGFLFSILVLLYYCLFFKEKL